MSKFKGNQTRDTITWGTYDGRRIKLKDIDDMHLANIIDWMKKEPGRFDKDIVKEFNKEAQRRELTESFLERAPFPYRNNRGQWILFINGRPTVVGRETIQWN